MDGEREEEEEAEGGREEGREGGMKGGMLVRDQTWYKQGGSRDPDRDPASTSVQ